MSNRTAPVGAVVRLYVDLMNQVKEGDVVETRTGRGYSVLSVRVQKRGKYVGRQHLVCTVLHDAWLEDLVAGRGPLGAIVHRIRWYRRRQGAGVVVRR